MTEALERKEAQLNEVLAQANLESAVVGDITSKLEDVVETRNQVIRDLQAELQRLLRSHARVVDGYEGKLREYGIPPEEVGFVPRRDLVPPGLLPSDDSA